MAIDPVAALEDGVSALLEVDLIGLDRDQLLALVGRVETVKRRLAVVDHQLIAALDDRGVAADLCMASTAVVLSRLLRISPGEAKHRVRAAADLGPRRSLLGEPLGPVFERVAAAQAAGLISAEQARVIVRAVEALPSALAVEHDRQVEATLVEHALAFDPTLLHTIAVKLADVLDPDGSLPDDGDHQRRREFLLGKHRDGSSTPSGYWGPVLTARVEAYLDACAAPRPAADGVVDSRTPGQRNHDALEDGLAHLLGCSSAVGGGVGTLIITMSAAQYESRRGHVLTPHGSPISVATALELTSDGWVGSLLFDPHGGVMSYGRTRRLVPPAMRVAITARDKGCTFPGCDRPPAYTQAHHLTEWLNGGVTSVDNCTLACSYHHREFQKRGWQGVMIDGRVHWVPPTWIDPKQTPRLNTMHDPPLRV